MLYDHLLMMSLVVSALKFYADRGSRNEVQGKHGQMPAAAPPFINAKCLVWLGESQRPMH